MKIYTKILIGMAVGAIIGLTIGPTSEFLEHDSFQVDSAAQVTILVDKDDPDSALSLPPGAAMTLRGTETVYKDMVDGHGKTVSVPAFARVSFKFTKRMSLADKGGVIAKSLGDAKVGKKVEAWLVMTHRILDSGDLLVLPVPVSSIGTTMVAWVSPIGKLFMRLIKMVIVPLVFASLLVGVAGLGDVRKLGRLGGRTLGL